MPNKLIESFSNLLLLLLFFMAAVSYNGKFFGKKAEDYFSNEKIELDIQIPNQKQLNQLNLANITLEEKSKGNWLFPFNNQQHQLINTLAYNEKVYGFGGPVPLLLHINPKGEIQNIHLLENNETPEFIESILEEGIIEQWIGKNANSLTQFKPDAVSGATMSSSAINQSISNTLVEISGGEYTSNWYSQVDLKTIIAFLVILLGVLLSFKFSGNKKLRTVQLILNVAILAIWCGKFISLKVIMGWTANGVNLMTSGIVFLMLLLAIFIPVFTHKKSFYCLWICPFGSAQELAGKLKKKKWTPGKKTSKILKHTQTAFTLGLFFLLWMGLASDIINYEPFSAFLFKHASIPVIIIASMSIISAIFIPRPWCNYLCPTGQILKWTHKMN